MKLIIAGVLCLFANIAFATESLECSFRERGNPRNFATTVIEIKPVMDYEYLYPRESLNVGRYNFSVGLELTRQGNLLSVGATFTENNRTEDEIDNVGWDIDLNKATPRRAVLRHSIRYDRNVLATFVCYYRKN